MARRRLWQPSTHIMLRSSCCTAASTCCLVLELAHCQPFIGMGDVPTGRGFNPQPALSVVTDGACKYVCLPALHSRRSMAYGSCCRLHCVRLYHDAALCSTCARAGWRSLLVGRGSAARGLFLADNAARGPGPGPCVVNLGAIAGDEPHRYSKLTALPG